MFQESSHGVHPVQWGKQPSAPWKMLNILLCERLCEVLSMWSYIQVVISAKELFQTESFSVQKS